MSSGDDWDDEDTVEVPVDNAGQGDVDDADEDFIARSFQCPYCWESVEPPLEADLEGELVWDCEVCCRPWLIRIGTDLDGSKWVTVDRAQN